MWKVTFNRPREDSGKPSGHSDRENRTSPALLYGDGEVLLTSTGDDVVVYGQNFWALLRSREVQFGDLRIDVIPLASSNCDLQLSLEWLGLRVTRV